MFAPAPLPRNLEASFRDLGSEKPATRAASIRDVVRHAHGSGEVRDPRHRGDREGAEGRRIAAVRAGAATALADLGASEALPTLLVAVEDDDAHVRQMALSALGEIGDVRAAQRLEPRFATSGPRSATRRSSRSLACRGTIAAVWRTALVRALDNRDEAIRYIAMRVAEEQLGTRGGAASDERLAARARELVDGTDEAVAVVAGLYLARMGEARGRQVVLDVVAERLQPPELEDEQACVELSGESSCTTPSPTSSGGRGVAGAYCAPSSPSARAIRRAARGMRGSPWPAWATSAPGVSCWPSSGRGAARPARPPSWPWAAPACTRRAASCSECRRASRTPRRGGGEAAGATGKGGSVDAALVREALVRLAVD